MWYWFMYTVSGKWDFVSWDTFSFITNYIRVILLFCTDFMSGLRITRTIFFLSEFWVYNQLVWFWSMLKTLFNMTGDFRREIYCEIDLILLFFSCPKTEVCMFVLLYQENGMLIFFLSISINTLIQYRLKKYVYFFKSVFFLIEICDFMLVLKFKFWMSPP